MTLLEELETVLKKDKRFVSEDRLLKNKIIELGLKYDEDLLKLLLANEKIKEHFFIKVDSILVFDNVKFMRFIDNKEFLPDSYTAFKNKIGLTTNGNYISKNKEVVLSWPYKDCILEGGQEKGDEKRDEIFHNEILAPDEIDRLLEPKVLTNFKKVDEGGEHKVTEIKPTDNLIIKGNNLLALHSIKKKFAGKIKLIYIDPPYYFSSKKSEDTFSYNLNFKLSTWLTFMKNRLEIARELLSEEGSIFVQINDDGVAELHRLMKEIFNVKGENNFINKITVKTKSPSGFASINPGVFETAEYIISFAKNKKKWVYNTQYMESEYDENYKWFIPNIEEDCSVWKIVDLFEHVASEKGYKSKMLAIKELGEIPFYQIVADFALDNAEKVFRYTAISDAAASETVDIREKSKENMDKIFHIKREAYYDIYIQKGNELAFYSKKIRNIDGKLVPSIQLSNIWIDVPYEGISKEGDVTLKGGKKPEKLLKRIIEMASNPQDIVLDFFLGSGTTCAVAHKISRQYIGIEQLDYGENDSVIRLKNVINGDSTGISKAVNWNGGGEFIYCKLRQLNEKYIQLIKKAENTKKLIEIWEIMKRNAFLSYRVDPKYFESDIKEFKELSFENQKKFLIESLDKNHLYVNYSEINDKQYDISKEEIELNTVFYRGF